MNQDEFKRWAFNVLNSEYAQLILKKEGATFARLDTANVNSENTEISLKFIDISETTSDFRHTIHLTRPGDDWSVRNFNGTTYTTPLSTALPELAQLYSMEANSTPGLAQGINKMLVTAINEVLADETLQGELAALDYSFPCNARVWPDNSGANTLYLVFNVEDTLNSSGLYISAVPSNDIWLPKWYDHRHTSWKSNQATELLTNALVERLNNYTRTVVPYDPFDL